MANSLEPPDSGSTADTSEGEDHFSDASEGKQSDVQTVPATHVERVDDSPSHGELPETASHDPRKADEQSDVVAQAPKVAIETFTIQEQGDGDDDEEEDDEDENDSGEVQGAGEDDFDDFEEGAEDDDFGTFDPGAPSPDQQADWDQAGARDILPLFDLNGLDTAEAITTASQPYLQQLFPAAHQDTSPKEGDLAQINRSFLTERSQSLWSQLVAPPPLQPPNWIRSRIRRLFLVSLGVPVDLDEILPASKQKKLVLPSIEVEGETGPTEAAGSRSNGAVSKLKQDNASAASLASTPSKAERKKRGPAPPPVLDMNNTRIMCSTTEVALNNLSDQELQQHVSTLDDLKQRAGKVLEYWLIQRDSAKGDKEAFEEVIENLVKHAKRIRK